MNKFRRDFDQVGGPEGGPSGGSTASPRGGPCGGPYGGHGGALFFTGQSKMFTSESPNSILDKTKDEKELNFSFVKKKDDEDNPEKENRAMEDHEGIKDEILYGADDVPPWYFCLFLGFQHYIIMLGSTLTIPHFLTPFLCIADDDPARGQIISSILFVSGIVTMLQTTLGIRLAIVQGGTFSFLLPTIAILTTSFPSCDSYDFANMTKVEKDEVWTTRIREIQGAIIASSFLQIVAGFTGVVGYLLSWISPLTIVPTVTLIGLAIFKPATDKAAGNWGIAFLTAALMVLFSQYIYNVGVPYPVYTNNKITWRKAQIFKYFPIILAIAISWATCLVLTESEAIPRSSEARTDIKMGLVSGSPWFYVPYPFQWGMPTFSVSGIIGMAAGVLSSMAESIGDYYACARLSGAESPPQHAVNRAMGIEGIGCLIAGIIGTGNGTTSYSDNIGAIRITKVSSRRVIQVAAVFMIICGMFGKFGAVFMTIPNPVIGGVFIVMFSIIVSVGLSNLQVVDLNSSRNIFILGLSLFCGLAIPDWMNSNPGAIQTGSEIVDRVFTVLLSTNMFVGGGLGLILDNTIPGTDEERGLTKWNTKKEHNVKDATKASCYDLPFGMSFYQRTPWCSKIPFSPTYEEKKSEKPSCYQRVKRKLFGTSVNKCSP